MNWNKIEDKLPEEGDTVLAYRFADDWLVVCDYYNGEFNFNDNESQVAHAITHWQHVTFPKP